MAQKNKDFKREKMNKKVFYTKEHDIFSVHNGFSGSEKFKCNVDIGDLILDLSNKGQVKGIEILNASGFLKEFGITPEILENLTDAELNASVNPNSIILGITIKSKAVKNELVAKIAVPLEMPVA